jgi:hypothetical protein
MLDDPPEADGAMREQLIIPGVPSGPLARPTATTGRLPAI